MDETPTRSTLAWFVQKPNHVDFDGSLSGRVGIGLQERQMTTGTELEQEGHTNMMKHRGFSAGQIALVFLGGAAAGSAVTMLIAPQSGRETRAQLATRVRHSKKKVARLPDQARDVIDSASDAARKAFEGALAKAEIDFRTH